MELMLEAGLLTLRDGDGEALLTGAFARVQLTDGSTYTTQGGVVSRVGEAWLVEAASAGLHVRPDAQVQLTWQVTPTAAGVSFRLTVRNAGPSAVAIARLDVLVAPTGWRGTPYDDLELSQAGWQSWSYASPIQAIAGHTRANFPPIAAPMLPPSVAEVLHSPWMVELPGAALGFTAARSQLGVVTIQPAPAGGHRLSASTYPESRRLERGDSLQSEPLCLFLGSGAGAAYAAAAASEMGARSHAKVPTGWCSWYEFFTAIDEGAMIRNLDVLTAERERLPVEVIQLDDGYQTAIGDWLSVNPKFPGGLRALTDRIHDAGFQAGLWLAPFLIAEDSQLASAHPEWVLRDAHGDPVAAIENWSCACWALDLTHPGVIAWLDKVITTIVETWGFDYLKLDFIYAGALQGVRHEAGVTGVEAYRRGLSLIRAIAGDRFVLGCGAPFLPSLGLVDGMRISPDTGPNWDHADPQGSAPALKNAIRSTLAHHWMQGSWWVNAPTA